MMNFSQALELLKSGSLLSREGWNGRGMFIYLVQGSRFEVNRPPLNEIYSEGKSITYRSHIDMSTANGECVPWVASQSDLLSDDWKEVVLNESEL